MLNFQSFQKFQTLAFRHTKMNSETNQTLLRLFYANGNSPTEAMRAYRRETGKKSPLNEWQVRRLVKRFEDTSSTEGRRPGSGRPPSSLEEMDKVFEVKDKLQDDHPYGMCSMRQIAEDEDVTISKSSIHRLLRKEGFHPYRPVQVQQLLPHDFEARVAFAKRALEIFGSDFSQILWTDEAIFRLTPNVSSLNGAIWATEQPNLRVETPLHDKSVHVWAGFSSHLKLPPYFFTGTVTGEAYLTMLTSHCLPFLTSHRALSRTTFQQDGAAPHIATAVKHLLTKKFGSRIISRHFDFQWPARSPDLSPMDFFYWGYLKRQVYSRKLSSIDELKTAISEELDNLDQEMLEHVVSSMPSRLHELIDSEGRQIRK